MHTTSDVSPVHHKLTESRESEMLRHNVIEDDDSGKWMKNWREEVGIPDTNGMFYNDFIEMLIECRPICVRHLGRKHIP